MVMEARQNFASCVGIFNSSQLHQQQILGAIPFTKACCTQGDNLDTIKGLALLSGRVRQHMGLAVLYP